MSMLCRRPKNYDLIFELLKLLLPRYIMYWKICIDISVQINEFSLKIRPSKIRLRLTLKSTSELFECECNIVNGVWTLCRGVIVLRQWSSSWDRSLEGERIDSDVSSLGTKGSEIVCRSRICHFPSGRRSEREVAELACHTRWACKPCSRLGTLYKHSRTCRAAAARIGCPGNRALSLIHRCNVTGIILPQSEVTGRIANNSERFLKFTSY